MTKNRSKRVFISYRRDDCVFSAEGDPGDDANRSDTASTQDIAVGIREHIHQKYNDAVSVTVDVRDIEAIDDWLKYLYEQVTECDLFILLIGNKWTEILKEKNRTQDPDILCGEIELALSHDRRILPIILNGAQLPARDDLPDTIRGFLEAQSDEADLGTVTAKTERHINRIKPPTNTEKNFRPIYFYIGLAIWLLTGIIPNLVGFLEFGTETWLYVMFVWGNFFIWPLVFVPFALYALYLPFESLLQSYFNADDSFARTVSVAPIILSVFVGIIGATLDANTKEVIWTVKPRDGNCLQDNLAKNNTKTIQALLNYDAPDGNLRNAYLNTLKYSPVWLREGSQNKCWPSVFYYLIKPQIDGIKLENIHIDEKRNTLLSFQVIEDNSQFSHHGFSRTNVFYFYVISLSILFFLMSFGLMSSLFFSILSPVDSIFRRRDLRLPNENAVVGLFYALLTLLMWQPFRAIALHHKECLLQSLGQQCTVFNDGFLKDFVFAAFILFGFTSLLAATLLKIRQLRIAVNASYFFIFVICIIVLTYTNSAFLSENSTVFIGTTLIVSIFFLFFITLVFRPERMRQQAFLEKYRQ